jgi:hypothetical protein
VRVENLPGLSESLARANDKTSSDSTTNGNHSDVSRLEASVQMLVISVYSDTIAVNLDWYAGAADGVFLVAVVLVAVLRIRVRARPAVRRRRSSLVAVPDGHVSRVLESTEHPQGARV